ncbi:MAG TPA: MoaD/ThiS family protein [Bacteroidales bacterium]|nr:MoaD/ThiS family protein [Bacteroidales bacterium]
MIKVLYFGIAQEIAGKTGEEFGVESTTGLRRQIYEKYPRMKTVVFRLALNGTMLTTDTSLKDNDIIALLPPFAGG